MPGYRSFLLSTATASAVATLGTTALAQGAPDATTSVNLVSGSQIEEIVVTARRREESLQTVPVAVSVVTAQDLRSKSISTPYDLLSAVPGLTATSGGATKNDVQYFIRGQGSTYGSAASVVTYFADVPQQANSGSGGSNITFYDLDSVQVLKGPQGTLFGRSTTGGAVLLAPRRPSGEFDGFAELTLGNYATKEVTAAVNIPLIGEKLAIRIAGNYGYHHGYAKSVTTGQDLDDRNRGSYRIGVMARPTEALSNFFLFQDQIIDEHGSAPVLYRFDPNFPLLDTGPAGAGRFTAQFICGLIGGGQPCVDQRIAILDTVRNGYAAEYARLQAANKHDRRQPATTFPDFLHSRVQQVINTTQYDVGEVGFLGDTSVKNIFSMWRNLRSDVLREITGSPNNSGTTYNDLNYINGRPEKQKIGRTKWGDIWSEEFQVSGRALGKHDWIVGYFTESTNRSLYLNWASLFTTYGGAFTVPAGLPGIASNIFSDYKQAQSGIFGQTTIDLADVGLDGFKFTAGYRRSSVKNSLTDVPTIILPALGVIPIPGGMPVSASVKQHANSYNFSLDWHVSPDVMLYAATRRGFKQGGLNVQSVREAQAGTPGALPVFKPEIVTDYEIGAKADWTAAGVRGRSNIAVYNSKFRNLQRNGTFVNSTSTVSAQIANIAASRVRGVELENTVQLTPSLRGNLTYSYMDAKYTRYPGSITNNAGVVIQRIDTPITSTPKHQVSASLQYTLPVPEHVGVVRANVDFAYRSKTILDEDQIFDPVSEAEPGYSLINARLDWNNAMGSPVDLSLFVRNLTNKLYAVGGPTLYGSLGVSSRIYGDPRTIGIQGRVRFGASANH